MKETVIVRSYWIKMFVLLCFFCHKLIPLPNSGVRLDWVGPGRPVGGAGRKSWNKVYSIRRYPFMNNNSCQIYFILLPNLLVRKEIINIQKLITHVTHCLSWVFCYTAALLSFKAPGLPETCPVRPTTGIWLRAKI